MADLSEAFKEYHDKLYDSACKLPEGYDRPKPIDPALYSALNVEKTARRIMKHGDVLKFLVSRPKGTTSETLMLSSI